MTLEDRAAVWLREMKRRSAERRVLRATEAVVNAADVPASSSTTTAPTDPIERLGALAWQLVAFLLLAGAAAGLLLGLVAVLVARNG